MKVIIAGSREIDKPYTNVRRAVEESGYQITEVVSGTARGIDRAGEQWAFDNNTPIRRFPADWSLGPRAGYERNCQMADYADTLISVWDGKSNGTRHMQHQMLLRKKPVYILQITK